MKKIATAALITCLGGSAFAHNLWVKGSNEDTVRADIIYGHDFPNPEPIAKDREILFEPIEIIGEKKHITLVQKGQNYRYVGNKKLREGTYIVKATYKPTPWIETVEGKWEMNKTRKDSQKEVKSCGIYSMSAKSFIRVENSDASFITEPLGKGLEITPLVNLSQIKKDSPIKFKVTNQGKPVKFLNVYGSFEGYSDDEMSKAFYAKTDLKGEFIFKPLKSGLWYLEANHEQKSGNADCEKTGDKATVSFEVK